MANKEASEMAKIAQATRACFDTPSGKIVLDDLKKQFYDVQITVMDPHVTAIRAAQHDVVLYILDAIEGIRDEV